MMQQAQEFLKSHCINKQLEHYSCGIDKIGRNVE